MHRFSFYFTKDKTKSRLSAFKCKINKVPKIITKYKNQTTFKGHILRLHIRWNNVRRVNGSRNYY